MLLPEKEDAVRYGSITETTQSLLSYETCVELRSRGFDETNVPTGASSSLFEIRSA